MTRQPQKMKEFGHLNQNLVQKLSNIQTHQMTDQMLFINKDNLLTNIQLLSKVVKMDQLKAVLSLELDILQSCSKT